MGNISKQPINNNSWWQKRMSKSHTKKHSGHSREHTHSHAEKVGTQTTTFYKNEKFWIVLFLALAIFASVFFRMYPAQLPATQEWAQDSIYGQIQQNIAQQVSAEYPNLPTTQRDKLVDEQFNDWLLENEKSMQEQIQQQSTVFKERLQNEDGHTYLLAIDPYYYLRYSQHLIETGQSGTTFIGGSEPVPEAVSIKYGDRYDKKKTDWDGQRMAPVGARAPNNMHTHVNALVYTITKPFGMKSPMRAAFFVPVIISALAVIPAFFIGRKFAGTIGGLFAGLMLAIHSAFLNRTVAGFSDTDAYNVFFPLLIVWLFLEAYDRKNLTQKLIFSGLAGLTTGIFAWVWNWWFIFYVVVGTIGIYLLYVLIQERKEIKHLFTDKRFMNSVYTGLTYVVSSAIFVSLITSIKGFFNGLLGPLGSAAIKDVATSSLWPNVKTTVAELNAATLGQTVHEIGGLFLFIIAILGIVFAFLQKDKENKFDVKLAILLTLWFAASIFASTRGIRFVLLLVPAFSIAFGVFCGNVFEKLSTWIKENNKQLVLVGKIAIVLALATLLIQPTIATHNQAKNEIPSMNDAWYNTLTKINEEAPQDAIINSWWDFGHWFITIADRRVTFDGAGNDNYMAYWVGRSLTSTNPDLTTGILRMVNCGNNNAAILMEKYTNDTAVSIDVLNEIVLLNKEDAKKILLDEGLSEEQSNRVLKYSHCQSPQDYYIVSEDMVGKAGVWAHFGNWDFHKAQMYNIVSKSKTQAQAVTQLVEKTDVDEEKASQLYYDATALSSSREVDSWISPWPQYVTPNAVPCGVENNTITCVFNQLLARQNGADTVLEKVEVPLSDAKKATMTILGISNGIIQGSNEIIPQTITVGTTQGYTSVDLDKSSFPYEVVIAQYNNQTKAIVADPHIAQSSFTKLFFFDGLGMKGYEKFNDVTSFTGDRIIVYTLDPNTKKESQTIVNNTTIENVQE